MVKVFMPQFTPNGLNNEEDRPRDPEILSVLVEFLCIACGRRLSVEGGSGGRGECAWCHAEIELPRLSFKVQEPTEKRETPLLSQEELEFLTRQEPPGHFEPPCPN